MTQDTVYEFRNYALHPGRREVLLDIFERYFIEAQEEGGAHVVATFRDLDDPDRFVWIRGFADMEARAAALHAFYSGAVWQEHRSAANATIIDSDNVLQLKPVAGGLDWRPESRTPIGATDIPPTLIAATTYFLKSGSDEAFAARFAAVAAPVLAKADAAPFAMLATDHRPNSYPRLPVREDESVFLALARFGSAAEHAARTSALAASPSWQEAEQALQEFFVKPPETLRLQPTARSLLR